MIWKRIDTAVSGALCLTIGWGAATLLHELCHLITARSLGLEATAERCTLSTGGVLIHTPMTPIETATVAVAGSIGLVIIGILLTKNHNSYIRLIGVIFLCRAWVDALPICGWDGGITAGAAGYELAVLFVIAEVLICGGVILDTVQRGLYKGHRSSVRGVGDAGKHKEFIE